MSAIGPFGCSGVAMRRWKAEGVPAARLSRLLNDQTPMLAWKNLLSKLKNSFCVPTVNRCEPVPNEKLSATEKMFWSRLLVWENRSAPAASHEVDAPMLPTAVRMSGTCSGRSRESRTVW